MEGDLIKINKGLLPLSWLYGAGVWLRNTLFDMGVLKSHSYRIPVVSVGNITVGGTGKTPHVEYLIRLLREKTSVAVLSRGYKRKTRGFLIADEKTTMRDIGDEPYQMKRKFPDVTVVVDKKRTRGIEHLMDDESLGVILLDDAFQHRYVKPGISILLVDYHRLAVYDTLLPAGRLREPIKSKDRADIVIVTKCPKEMKPMEYRVITKAMRLYAYQQLYFSTYEYDDLQPLFPEVATAQDTATDTLGRQNVLLLTGIALPEQMEEDLKLTMNPATVRHLSFPDHHNFRKKDVRRINEAFAEIEEPKLIVTTEKDATRLLLTKGLSDEVRSHLYVLPLKVRIMLEQEDKFNQSIINYVRKNSRNSIMAKGKDADKSKDGDSAGNGPRTISF